MSWCVLDMDDGLLREVKTRKEAVEWAVGLHGSKVLERHSYGPGAFQYVIGYPGEDRAHSVFIERRDVATKRGGWDLDQEALYPLYDEPYRRVERESGTEPLSEGDAR